MLSSSACSLVHQVLSAIRIDTRDNATYNKNRHGIKHDFAGMRFCYNKDTQQNFFSESLGLLMEELLPNESADDDILRTITILTRLLKTMSTQQATARFLQDERYKATWEPCLTHLSQDYQATNTQSEFYEYIKALGKQKDSLKPLVDLQAKLPEPKFFKEEMVVNL